MGDFSLELNEDQVQLRDWVHDFAENVIRPVAHEWDEREETPWPLIQEAADVGLYSTEFFANAFGDPTGLTFPIVSEEMCWGDAGITLAIFGSTLAVSGIVGNGTPEQVAEWVPQCFGTPDQVQLGAFAVSVAITDNGSSVGTFGPSGTRSVAFHCPPTGHTYVLTATSSGGRQSSRDVTVTGTVPPSTSSASTTTTT